MTEELKKKLQAYSKLQAENENLKTQLKEFRITDTEVENELDSMKRILMAEIRDQIFPDKIKRHFQLYFGIPYESPEKLQLDQILMNHQNDFKALTDLIKESGKDWDRKFTLWKYSILVVAGALTGLVPAIEILRFLGLV